MSVITDTWRALVRRRLWPVALLLLAALVAVPLLLAEQPEPAAPPAAEVAPPTTGPGDSIVTLASVEDRSKRRRVLGKRKDPFEPRPARRPRVRRAARVTAEARAAEAKETTTSSAGTAGGATTVTPPTLPSVPTTRAEETPAEPRRARHTLTVRFGDAASAELTKLDVPLLSPLPDEEEPLLAYVRVEDKGKTAVFLVDAGVELEGDGKCLPDPAACEELHLREGETEFLDVKDEAGEVVQQYQLDLVAIH